MYQIGNPSNPLPDDPKFADLGEEVVVGNSFSIMVNGRKKKFYGGTMMYHQAVGMADREEGVEYTVAYSFPDGRCGTLVEGCPSLDVMDGLIINVARTNNG